MPRFPDVTLVELVIEMPTSLVAPTSNFVLGELVPIPKLPVVSMVSRVTALVLSLIAKLPTLPTTDDDPTENKFQL